jgi:hypothetical protein
MSAVPRPDPEGPPEPPIQPGQQFSTVLLGIPLGDRLSLFHDDGTVTAHTVPSDAGLADQLGRGTVTRSEVGEGFRREAALWDDSTATLLVTSRFGGSDSVSADLLSLSPPLPPGQAEAAPDAGEVHLFLTEVAKAAAAAGEAVYLSRGGWAAPPDDEYALFVSTLSPADEAMSHVETFPHPSPGTIWDIFQNRKPGRAIILRSPLEAGIDGVGPLLFGAASRFCPPNELALSFIGSRSRPPASPGG